jgi:hypothetical protein
VLRQTVWWRVGLQNMGVLNSHSKAVNKDSAHRKTRTDKQETYHTTVRLAS